MVREIPQQPIAYAFGTEPTVEVFIVVLRSMGSSKVVGPDELPVERLRLGMHHGRTGHHPGMDRGKGISKVAKHCDQAPPQNKRLD